MREDRPGGFITLHHQFWTSPDLTGMRAEHHFVFITILHLANWKDTYFWDVPRRIDVRRGELAHSIQRIAKEARATPKQVRTTIDNLLARGVLSHLGGTDTGTRVRVLRVVNYEKFQGIPARSGTANGKEPAKSGQSEGKEAAPSEQDQPVEPREPTDSPTPAAPVLALVPLTKSEKRAQKRPGGHPRHAGLVALLTDTFRDITGIVYGFRPVDGRKVSDLIALGDDSEVIARWKRGLTHQGFPTIRSLTDLVIHWNRFGGSDAAPARPKGMAAPSTDWTSKEATEF